MTLTDCSAPPAISIVIFDATGITSDLLRRAFSKQPEYNVVGCPKSIEETLRIVIERQPDTVVISAFERSGSVTAIELLNQLSRVGSAANAVILSANLTNEETVAYFRAQARGVLSGSSADFALLCKCVSCVHSGQIWANSEQLVCLIESLSQPQAFSIVSANGKPILTAREGDILRLLAEGLSNRDIAITLNLSEHTIKNHLFHIFDKLGVSSRMEAVVYFFNHGAVPKQPAKRICSAEKMSSLRANGAIAINQ